jgi:hypothetical protein
MFCPEEKCLRGEKFLQISKFQRNKNKEQDIKMR